MPAGSSGPHRVGTAGWSIPKQHAAAFPGQGTHLERYARRFAAVEVNSSFYRSHRPATYARWAASVPEGFRFAVKVPREITHKRKLRSPEEPFERFLTELRPLERKLGPLLVQLPPSLGFDEGLAEEFFAAVRCRFSGDVVCEPRHATWFTAAVDGLLSRYRVARVMADPPPVPDAARPGGWPDLVYRRLHGSPNIYRSKYADGQIDELAAAIGAAGESWCIFDNTAMGEATGDALRLIGRL